MLAVVHVATPAPKKSVSSVQIGQSAASAHASTGQSSGSRGPMRASARSLKGTYDSAGHGHDHVRKGLQFLQRRLGCLGRLAALAKDRRQVFSNLVEGDVGRKECHLRSVTGEQFRYATAKHGAHQDVGIEDDRAGRHALIAVCAATPRLCARP